MVRNAALAFTAAFLFARGGAFSLPESFAVLPFTGGAETTIMSSSSSSSSFPLLLLPRHLPRRQIVPVIYVSKIKSTID